MLMWPAGGDTKFKLMRKRSVADAGAGADELLLKVAKGGRGVVTLPVDIGQRQLAGERLEDETKVDIAREAPANGAVAFTFKLKPCAETPVVQLADVHVPLQVQEDTVRSTTSASPTSTASAASAASTAAASTATAAAASAATAASAAAFAAAVAAIAPLPRRTARLSLPAQVLVPIDLVGSETTIKMAGDAEAGGGANVLIICVERSAPAELKFLNPCPFPAGRQRYVVDLGDRCVRRHAEMERVDDTNGGTLIKVPLMVVAHAAMAEEEASQNSSASS